MHRRTLLLTSLVCAAAFAAAPAPARADPYPTKPIRWIAPFAAA